ncbi:unnamed protein product [Linum tenue]|uniref:CCHC-type domain-containing protein n=1 Tax=Linum tenue TaxID=586396 RepID=A0AAV0Q3V6_9ROSI|nr:unnamed protein product [Linum tenue]
MIGDYYITVRPWRRNFNPQWAEVATTMVWGRLPGLPREFINKEAVERIAGKIGRPVRVDNATETGDRGKFARVSVEVDLTKPLLSQYKIEGITYYIEYEGLFRICTECGKYGHVKATCPTLAKNPASPQPESHSPKDDSNAQNLYGEWMTVQPRGRNGKRGRGALAGSIDDGGHGNILGQKENLATGSRFAVLEENPMQGVISTHANPSNIEPNVDKDGEMSTDQMVTEKPNEESIVMAPSKNSGDLGEEQPSATVGNHSKAVEKTVGPPEKAGKERREASVGAHKPPKGSSDPAEAIAKLYNGKEATKQLGAINGSNGTSRKQEQALA